MSATVMLFKLTRRPKSIRELKEADCAPMGTLAEIHAALEAWMPGIVWNPDQYDRPIGERYGHLHNDQGRFRIKIDLPDEGTPCVSIDLSLRADARAIFAPLCQATGWTAFDTSSNTFFDGSEREPRPK